MIKQYRYELKFVINKKRADFLKIKLLTLMQVDEHYSDYYNIRSLYFDDVYNNAYLDKIDGILEREKYRIRVYNDDKKYISIELKGKDNNLTYKIKDNITYQEYQDIMNNNLHMININNRKLLERFLMKKRLSNLIPSVIVDYHRLALTYDANEVRVTFDEDIRSGRFTYDLFTDSLVLTPILDKDDIILEVKYNDKIPQAIDRILKSEKMVKTSCSKYALCVEKKGIF